MNQSDRSIPSQHQAFRSRAPRRPIARKRTLPNLEPLEPRLVLSATALGAPVGSAPIVHLVAEDGSIAEFMAYNPQFIGGVRVATGDINGDGTSDIITGMARGGGHVKVFDGSTLQEIASFFPYGRSFRGGVNVAFGHLTTEGEGDIITGTASGRPIVKVFDGATATELHRFTAYGRNVSGVQVAAGNLDGDYLSEIITAPALGGGPHIKIFDGQSGRLDSQFFAYARKFRGGVQIATADLDNNRIPDLVTVAARGHIAGTVRVWNGSSQGIHQISSFQAAPQRGEFGPVVLGTVSTAGPEADQIAITRTVRLPLRGPGITPSSESALQIIPLYDANGAAVGTMEIPSSTRARNIASAPAPVFRSYQGTTHHGVSYNPSWPNWAPTAGTQLFDSDFFNDAFKGLWGTTSTGQGRNDLATIQSGGFNLVRLYNWSPTRGPNDSAHLSFLDQAKSLGMNVIVPVSDYFLTSDQFAWGNSIPANNDFTSAPAAIQTALNDFIASVTKNGTIHPAVHSISVGNEPDLGIDTDPAVTVKLQRAFWWIVNLQARLSQPGLIAPGLSHPLLTIPISNADQGAWGGGQATGSNSATTLQQPNSNWPAGGFNSMVVKIVTGTGAGQTRTITANSTDTLTVSQPWNTTPDASSGFVIEPPNPRSWFEIFQDGVTSGERVPIGSVPGGPANTFTTTVPGLSTYTWYRDWFFNSLNTFQVGSGLSNLLTQYDTGLPSGNAFTWSQQWPGAKLDAPLLLTELGFSRFNITAQAQSDVVANDQAQVATNVIKTAHNLMGYTIFEFNDEPNKNGTTGPPFSEAFFGISYFNANQNDFRNGTLLYNLQTGTTPWAGGTLPNLTFPVYQLTLVPSGSTTLLERLKRIFAQSS